MKHFAMHSSNTKLKIALQELVTLVGQAGVASLVPKSVYEALTYAAEVEVKLAASKQLDWKEEFFEYFNSDQFSETVSAEESENLFLTSLRGSSDITYPLLVKLGAEYEVNIDDVINEGRNFY